MSLEWFLKLREIESLGKMRINHLKVIDEQAARVAKLLERKEVTTLQTASLGQTLRTLQHNMFECEKKLKLASDQKANLESLGGDDKKITAFKQDIERFENEGFELLEEQEKIQTEINDNNTFITGLEKTIAEIDEEAGGVKKSAEAELSQIEMRIGLLRNELPDNFRQILERVTQKKLAHGPFTRVDQGSCFLCRYKISRQEESEIDMQQNLKTCSQCGRIFLPYGA